MLLRLKIRCGHPTPLLSSNSHAYGVRVNDFERRMTIPSAIAASPSLLAEKVRQEGFYGFCPHQGLDNSRHWHVLLKAESRRHGVVYEIVDPMVDATREAKEGRAQLVRLHPDTAREQAEAADELVNRLKRFVIDRDYDDQQSRLAELVAEHDRFQELCERRIAAYRQADAELSSEFLDF